MTEIVKPFKIIDTRIEDDGETGVLYRVQKSKFVSSGRVELVTMEGYMSVPAGEDIEQFLFEQLSKAGWF